jgi:hypothetical protein
MKSGAWWNKLFEGIIKQGYPLWIVIFSQFTLFGLISYRLITQDIMTEEEKKMYSYAELALSFVASLIFLGMFYLFFIFFAAKFPSVVKIPMFYLGFIAWFILFFVTPLGLTTLRVTMRDKLTEQQNDVLLGLTLPSMVVFGWIGLLSAVGNIR